MSRDIPWLGKWPVGQIEIHASTKEEAERIVLEYIKAKGLVQVQPHTLHEEASSL